MHEASLSAFFKKQEPASLIASLEAACDTMSIAQRRKVFGSLPLEPELATLDEAQLLNAIKTFYEESLQGVYYAPFEINSKDYMHIPKQTEQWFDKLGALLQGATGISAKGNHALAVECFTILYQFIDEMLEGEEIVFADEYGTWMIPGDEKTFIRAHLHSLSVVSTPEGFAEAVMPLVKRDSHESLANKVYQSAVKVAGKEQKKLLESLIPQNKIRVK
jgi:hypothetical protein